MQWLFAIFLYDKHLHAHCFLLCSILPSIRVFSNESALHIRWPKYWSFSFNISPSNEYSGLISFRMDWISLQSKGLSRVFSNTTVQKHQFFRTAFMVQLSHPYMTTGKTIAVTRWTFVNKVITLSTNKLCPSSQSYGFSSGHVWMWELNYKDSWVLKN